MKFTTNKYTRPVLLSNLRSINANSYSSLSSFASALSPRAGVKSAQMSALKSVVGAKNLNTIFNTSSNGTVVKQTLISLIKNS